MEELNRNESITVGTSSIIASKDKSNSQTKRVNINIINTSAAAILTIAIDQEAKDNEGIPISPGGSWSDNAETGYKPTQKAVNIISSIIGGTFSLQERSAQ